MKISIVMPAYNEESRIGRTLEEYSNYFDRLLREKKMEDYEILVVINGTRDKTEEIVNACAKENKRIAYLNFKRGGKGFAVTEGFKNALKSKKAFDFIGFVDADMATSPEEYWKLVRNIGGYDGAIADRYMRGAKIIPAFSFRRIIVSRGFNMIVRSLFGLRYSDTQCGAKVFKRFAIAKILNDLTITQWAFDIDMLYSCKKNKLKIRAVPTIWKEVADSKLRIGRASIAMLFAVIQLRVLRSRYKGALRVVRPIIGIIYKAIK